MKARDFYQAGRLQAALEDQLLAVKDNPTDPKKRLFLFELSSFAGDWVRARRQLEAMVSPDPEIGRTIHLYKHCLDAEEHRRKVYIDGVMPNFFTTPPDWVYPRLEAIKLLKAGKAAEAKACLAESDAACGDIKLAWNDGSVAAVRDCDDLLGPVLEVFANGAYFWLPMSQIQGVLANPPKTPRDLIWFPARVSVLQGPAGDAYLPALYFNTPSSTDDQVRLGRLTDWIEHPEGPTQGIGLKFLLVGEEAFPLPDLQKLLPA